MSDNNIYSPPESIVENHEAQDSQHYAGFWVRVGALVVDSILVMVITMPILWLIYGSLIIESDAMILGPLDFIISYVLPIVGVILFWTYYSATPGKMALNLKVVDATTGGKLTLGQSALRYIGYIPSTLVVGLGYLWVIWDPKKQGWHDKIANTVVVRPDNSQLPQAKFEP